MIINNAMRTTIMTTIAIARRENDEHQLRSWSSRETTRIITGARRRRERWKWHINEQSGHQYLTSSSTCSWEQMVDLTTGALHEQLLMNHELMWQCNELKKLLNKWQPSPTWDHYQSPKQYRDSRAMIDHRRQEDEIDEFLKGDGDFLTHR
ncbi:hypothetical protein ARMGADRAFT_1038448 [Armillaria gallica]|uniref:Uncharacterized protein n=1 Tax=Armillaria gallica TaxID=47427 RepID=A0A2H3CLA0_ARMGA|nr:hypothetical protein ARMGADRAFT_1038448 [Armillaria gallica]